MRKYVLLFLIVITSMANAKDEIVVTIHPLKAIVEEIAGPTAEVVCLVPANASPHTYAPKPSDMIKIKLSAAFLYVADNLDGWAAKLGKDKAVSVINMLPENEKYYFAHEHDHEHGHVHECGHDHGIENEVEHSEKDIVETRVIDPHFWTNPLTVHSVVDAIADTLGKIMPEKAGAFKTNAGIFKKRLGMMDREISQKLAAHKGKTVFLFHPSFNYLLRQYKITYGGSIESSPGKEPTAKYIKEILDKIKNAGCKAIFTEPQLPEGPAKSIAEQGSLGIYVLDPVGGVSGREKYKDLILYNVGVLDKALRQQK